MASAIRVISVGLRAPSWVRTAVDDYCKRLPPEWRIEWREVKPEPRRGASNAQRWRAVEATRIRTQLPNAPFLVALDERGDDLTSQGLAAQVERWRASGRAPVILIGGPDGLDDELLREADQRLRLSSLTLPHALVRVVLAEQLFRAWSIHHQHPYHRE